MKSSMSNTARSTIFSLKKQESIKNKRNSITVVAHLQSCTPERERGRGGGGEGTRERTFVCALQLLHKERTFMRVFVLNLQG